MPPRRSAGGVAVRRHWPLPFALLVIPLCSIASCGEVYLDPIVAGDATVVAGAAGADPGAAGAAGASADECLPSENFCSGVCANLSNDPLHCGECDIACEPGALCAAGRCLCPAANLCTDTCVDTLNDPLHCGGCDLPCAPEEICVEGKCTVP
nr:MAG: hypothetical protein DIU78_08705 [Pseudomonadota bacterium]